MKKLHNQDSAMHRIQVCYLAIHSAHPQDPLLLVSAWRLLSGLRKAVTTENSINVLDHCIPEPASPLPDGTVDMII